MSEIFNYLFVKKRIVHILKRVVLWTLISVSALIIFVLALIYMPFAQDFIKDYALEKVNAGGDMKISLDRLRIRFPLNLELQGLTVKEASGDTMLHAGSAEAYVALMPLFSGKIDVTGINLNRAIYRLGTPDSTIYLTARIGAFSAHGIGSGFSLKKIELGNAMLDGADVTLALKDTTTVSTPPDTTVNAMTIQAGDLLLRNVNFRMAMEGTIDSLGTVLPYTRISGVTVDMGRHSVHVARLKSDSLNATYLTPPAGYMPEPMTVPEDTTATTDYPSMPWTITADNIGITGNATYAMAGASPGTGLDLSYIQVSDIDIAVDSFYNRASSIRVPLRVSAKERCGISLTASGVFSMDSAAMKADNFLLATPASRLRFSAAMGMGDLSADPNLPLILDADGNVNMTDVHKAFPMTADILKDIPASADLLLTSRINGTTGHLDINDLSLKMPGIISVAAAGQISKPMDFKRMDGKINIDGTISESSRLAASLLNGQPARGIKIPKTSIKGLVNYSPGSVNGDLAVRTGQGRLAVKGKWNRNIDGYSANLAIDRFPLASFLPSLEIDNISLSGTASGQGFDPYSRTTHLNADINLENIEYRGAHITDVLLSAALDTCRMDASISSRNPAADLDLDITAWLEPHGYIWDIGSDIRHLDLEALHLSQSPLWGALSLYTKGNYDTATGDIDADMTLNTLNFIIDGHRITAPEIMATLQSSDSLTTADITTGDLRAGLHAICSLDSLITKTVWATDTLIKQTDNKKIDIRPIQKILPHLTFRLTSGKDNAVAGYLTQSAGIHFREANLTLHNDSLISMQAHVGGFSSGETRIDDINFDANQHGRFLVYHARIDNKPGTMDNFAHVSLAGYVAEDRLSAMFKQSNITDRQGFFLGVNASVSDSTVNLKLVPYKPTIAYKKWTINPDNFLTFNYVERHLDANIKLMSDSSSLMLYTEHRADSLQHGQEDVILRLNNIRLSEWLSISPFAPPVKGVVGADMRFRWNEEGITGNGIVDLDNLHYGRDRVGTFKLDLDVKNDTRTRALHADVALLVDSVKVITATGALNDSTARNPFLLDFSMIHFPLRVVNPFLPKNMAQLSGMLNGKMDITGSLAEPIFNGYLDFDSTAVKLGLTGSEYRFSEAAIPVDSNVVKFNNFSIAGLNKNDLHVNGTVNARKLSDILLDLNMKARDMQLVNTSRPRGGANIYGKAFIDLDADVKGSMRLLNVDASVNILPGTNVTYVMTDAESVLTSRSTGHMVHFVQFSDTASVQKADSIAQTSMAMNIDANLIISEGSTINVDLSSNGKNKASIQSNANLTYTQKPFSDGRLTGRVTIDKGFVRYTPPFMSEKNFSFEEGSYVAFTGNIMNPSLNLRAVEKLKANVTQEGQNSRLINFDILLSVTNTLQNMAVKFDLSTNDDITIQNELSSMSPEQRANQAMNLLLYNMYTGPGTKANANLSGNPLFSFLESQINTWAANNIRGVDISFGIDQYNTSTDGAKGTTTSYSYRVSKTLFNDRFKIVVGGNYSTDADTDENFSQNLINDISFEYMLNRSGSMYVRLFRHVGYESILEGEITQTGVGFVLKRKLNSLRDIFKFK